MKKTFRMKIDDEEMTVTVERQGDELIVEREGEKYRVAILPTDSPTEHVGRSAAAPPAQPTGAPPATTPAADTPPAASPGALSGLPAPITGTIKEVLVTVGDSISQGERVVMMEAMKMDIEIVAPTSGKVAQVFVKSGDSVKEKQPLLRIE